MNNPLQNLSRYKDILGLFLKYGRGDLVAKAPLIDDPLPHAGVTPIPLEAEQLADDIEKLGPTFIKLAQLLSTRRDFIPEAYAKAMARLQDDVKPIPFEEIEPIVTVEIGSRISRAFAEFDPEPYAAASLGQTHRAVMRDGRQVMVKIQRPTARKQVAEDLEAMAEIAAFLDKHTDVGKLYRFTEIVDELRRSLMCELDYRLEMENLIIIGKNLKDFKNIRVPKPIPDYSSGRVLTMEFLEGKKITDISGIEQVDLDGMALADELFQAYLQQILVDGIFHADPHPGNVLLTSDHKIGLIDMGMVGRFGPQSMEKLLRLLIAISEVRADKVAEIAEHMGQPTEDFNAAEFRTAIQQTLMEHSASSLNRMKTGQLVTDIYRVGAEHGLRVPSECTMLGKTLMNLDEAGRVLAPDFDPNAAIRKHAMSIVEKRTMESLKPNNLIAALADAKEFLEKAPGRLNTICDMIADNGFRIKVDSINENLLVSTLQKIANRITLGLILAALILGASRLMTYETSFTILGYPGLAMILFALALLGAFGLAIEILRKDKHQDK